MRFSRSISIKKKGNKIWLILKNLHNKKVVKGFTIVLKKSCKKITAEFVSNIIKLEEHEYTMFQKEMLDIMANVDFLN